MTDHLPIYNSRVIKVYLEYLRKFYPHVNLDRVLNDALMNRFEVEDSAHWFSQQQTDRFNEIIAAETGNPDISHEAGRFLTSAAGMGPIKQLALGLVNVYSVFTLMEKVAPILTRGSTLKVNRLGSHKIEVTSTPKPGVNEKPYQCANRIGTLESIPKLFSDQYAAIEHTSCFHRGDDKCRYIVSWSRTAALTWRKLRNSAILMGLFLAIPLYFLMPPVPWLISLFLISTITMGLAMRAERVSRMELIKTLENVSESAREQMDEAYVRYRNALLIQEIGNVSSSLSKTENLLEKIAARMKKHLSYDRCMVLLADTDNRQLNYAAGYGFSNLQTEGFRRHSLKIDSRENYCLFVSCFQEKKFCQACTTNSSADIISSEWRQFFAASELRSMTCFPLVYENKPLGVLAVSNSAEATPQTASDLNLLQGIASQMAVSINNVISYSKLQQSEQKFRKILENIEDGYFEVDLKGCFTFVNRSLCRMTGYSRKDLIAMVSRKYWGTRTERKMYDLFSHIYSTGKPVRFKEFEVFKKNGDPLKVELSAALLKDQEGSVVGFQGLIRDVTERLAAEQEKRKLETQLLTAQKMESIGKLAGGIAHNFNNMLMGIQGNISLINMEIEKNNPVYERARTIEKIVESASKLTFQLLGFARGGKYEVKTLDLNALVESTSDTFEMTMKNIKINRNFSENLPAIEADTNQIEQVLWNLFVNAADAMPAGGCICLETRIALHNELVERPYKITPGKYVFLSFADSGSGMDEKTRERIFEPFFTTKPLGKGTGLGLASAYGIIKGHGGYIEVDSEEGSGTTFSIYLPASASSVQHSQGGYQRVSYSSMVS